MDLVPKTPYIFVILQYSKIIKFDIRFLLLYNNIYFLNMFYNNFKKISLKNPLAKTYSNSYKPLSKSVTKHFNESDNLTSCVSI